MKMMKLRDIFLFVAIPSIFALTVVGCGGGGDDATTPASSAVNNGVFLDGPVEGLTYQTVTQSGTTDAAGTFKYQDGENVTFSIGSVVLGEGIAQPTMTPIDLVGMAVNEKYPSVTNICRLLQSLDEDGDFSNGITITSAISDEVSGRKIDFSQSIEAFENDSDIQDLFDTLNALGAFSTRGKRKLCSALQAQNHMAETLNDIDDDGDGYTEKQGDCDDNDLSTYPGAPEICGDEEDNDCDGQFDETNERHLTLARLFLNSQLRT